MSSFSDEVETAMKSAVKLASKELDVDNDSEEVSFRSKQVSCCTTIHFQKTCIGCFRITFLRVPVVISRLNSSSN